MTTDAHTDALAATQASRSSPDAAYAAQNAQHRHPRRRQRHLRHLWEAMGTQRRSSRRGRRVLSCYLAHPGEEVQLVLVHLRAPPGGGRWGDRGVASRPSSALKSATWRAMKLNFACSCRREKRWLRSGGGATSAAREGCAAAHGPRCGCCWEGASRASRTVAASLPWPIWCCPAPARPAEMGVTHHLPSLNASTTEWETSGACEGKASAACRRGWASQG